MALCRKFEISAICCAEYGNRGMPLSGRPLRITGPMVLPFSSSRTITERSKSGPFSPPLAFEPWQKPQAPTKVSFPRATEAGSYFGGGAVACGASAWQNASAAVVKIIDGTIQYSLLVFKLFTLLGIS